MAHVGKYEHLKNKMASEPEKETIDSKVKKIAKTLERDPIEWTALRDILGLPGLLSARDVVWFLSHKLSFSRHLGYMEDKGKIWVYDKDVLKSGSWEVLSEGPGPFPEA